MYTTLLFEQVCTISNSLRYFSWYGLRPEQKEMRIDLQVNLKINPHFFLFTSLAYEPVVQFLVFLGGGVP